MCKTMIIKTNFVCLFTLCLFVISCSKDEKFDLNKYPQKWQLIKMNGQIPNSETTGKDMDWQEYYLLNSDGTFTKHREIGEKITEISGIFIYKDLSDGKYIEFNYKVENEIIGSCSSKLSEVLRVKSESKLLGTWLACDGPELEYDRFH